MAIIGGVATVITAIPLANTPSSGPAIVTDQLIDGVIALSSTSSPAASRVSRTA